MGTTEELVLLPELQANPKILNFSKGKWILSYIIFRSYNYGSLQNRAGIYISGISSRRSPNISFHSHRFH